MIVTDANGCTGNKEFLVKANNQFVYESIVYPTCDNVDNGSIQLGIVGMVGETFDILWDDGELMEDVGGNDPVWKTDIPEGEICAVISSRLFDCEVSECFDIEKVSGGVPNIETNLIPSCGDENSGMISLSIDGGAEPYSFIWSTGSTSSNISNLENDVNYCVTVTDYCEYTKTECYVLDGISLTEDIIVIPGCEDEGQLIGPTASGGTPPYSYVWKDISLNVVGNAKDLMNISSGLYTFLVTDANDCNLAKNEIILNKDYNLKVLSRPCEGFFDGEVEFSINNPLLESVSLVFDNLNLEFPELEVQESRIITDLGPGVYEVSLIIGDCSYTFDYSLSDEPTTLSFTYYEEEPNVCHFAKYCKEELILPNFEEFGVVDFGLAEGHAFQSCGAPILCNGDEVFWKNFEKDNRRVEELLVLTQEIIDAGEEWWYPADFVEEQIRRDGLTSCDKVRFCSATMHIWDLNLVDKDDCVTESLGLQEEGVGCYRVDCCFPQFDVKFCNDDIAGWLDDIDIDFDNNIELCLYRRYRLKQLLIWREEIELEYPNIFPGSQLDMLMEEAENDLYKYDQSNCVWVSFCIVDFTVSYHTPFEEVNCGGIWCDTENESGHILVYCENKDDENSVDVGIIRYDDDWPGNLFVTPNGGVQSTYQVLENATVDLNFNRLSTSINDLGNRFPIGISSSIESYYKSHFNYIGTTQTVSQIDNVFNHQYSFLNQRDLTVIESIKSKEYQCFLADTITTKNFFISSSSLLSHFNSQLLNENFIFYGFFQDDLVMDSSLSMLSTQPSAFNIQLDKTNEVVSTMKLENIRETETFWNWTDSSMLITSRSLSNNITLNDQNILIGSDVIFTIDALTGSIYSFPISVTSSIELLSSTHLQKNGVSYYLFGGIGQITTNSNTHSLWPGKLLILSVDSGGNTTWSSELSLSTQSEMMFPQLLLGEANELFLSLNLEGYFNLGQYNYNSAGGHDIFIINFDQLDGNVLGINQYGTEDDEISKEIFSANLKLFIGGEFDGDGKLRTVGDINFVRADSVLKSAFVSYERYSDLRFPNSDVGNGESELRQDKIDQKFNGALEIVPNPNSGAYDILIDCSQTKLGFVYIYNNSGSRIFTRRVLCNESGQSIIASSEIPHLTSGVYLVRFETDKMESVITKKLVIQ